MTLLVGSLFVEDVDSALAAVRRLAASDLVEFRIDELSPSELSPLVLGRARSAIVTVRSRDEGGRFTGTEDERIGLLARALDLGVEWVDVEWGAWSRARARLDGARTIVSRHDFSGVPEAQEVERFFRDARASGAAMGKLAVTPRSLRELTTFLDGFRREGVPGVALCMGRYGLLSRVLAARAGSAWVYGALNARATAPGQPTLADLRRPFRVPEITSSTRLFGILGSPLGHSLSPWIHNDLFDEHRFDAVYVPFETEDLDDFFAAADALDLRGFSVTIPHKQAVYARLVDVSDEARALGAVNTVVRSSGGWRGENFDAAGFTDALAGGPEARGSTAIVLGAGGAARAVAFALRGIGAHVVVGSRTRARADVLARDLGIAASDWDALPLDSAHVLVNATPLGMWPRVDETPIDVARLRGGAWVIDTIYNPIETRLLREARARGLRAMSGVEMFLGQAARQFRSFTGCQPDPERIRSACRERLTPRSVVLVGLRGSGKSTVGRIVAQARSVACVDLDDEITNEAEMTIAQIFAREGEPAFRERERRALESALERCGQVVAAGGGVVLDERNRRLLAERATCVYLEAPPETLVSRLAPSFAADSQRPSLTGLPLRDEIEKLARDRDALYRSVAHIVVSAGAETPEEVAARIVERLREIEG